MNNNTFSYGAPPPPPPPPSQPSNVPKPTSSGQILTQDRSQSPDKRQKVNYQQPQQIYNYQQSMYYSQSTPAPYYPAYQQPYGYSYQQQQQQQQHHHQYQQPYMGQWTGYPINYYCTGTSEQGQMTANNVQKNVADNIINPAKASDGDTMAKEEHPKEAGCMATGQNTEEITGKTENDTKLKDKEEGFEHQKSVLAGTQSKPVVSIPGTSITLTSDEDIEKWREERRKMWLLKISNNKEKHRQELGEEAEKPQCNAFQQTKKEKQFIQKIQNQVNRFNPRPNLNMGIVQRVMADQNSKLLDFIKELGDAKLLEYELNAEEKEKLFGSYDRRNTSTDNRNSWNSPRDVQGKGSARPRNQYRKRPFNSG